MAMTLNSGREKTDWMERRTKGSSQEAKGTKKQKKGREVECQAKLCKSAQCLGAAAPRKGCVTERGKLREESCLRHAHTSGN